MKNEEAGVVSVGLIVVLIIVIIFGSFYFYSKNQKNKKTEVKKFTALDLENANVKVAKETSHLNFLESRYNAQSDSIREIQSQYSKISDEVLNKTDILFNNPESKNPEIKINLTQKIKDEVNSKRLEITEAINSWNDTIELINSNQDQNKELPTLPALVQKAKEDAVLVNVYVKELESIVQNLTPTNSGLTQNEINNYQTSTEAALVEANKISYDTQAITTPVVQTPSSPEVDTSTQVTTEPVTQSNSNNSTSSTVPPVVTQTEIKNQEQIVADAVLQQKIIEEAISTTTEPIVPPTQPSDQISYPSSDTSIPSGTPFQGIDKTGWPDVKPDENSKGPALLQGSNAI